MARSVAGSVLVATVLLCSCNEMFESRYANKAEADRDGAISRGWIPSWLPASATDIREIHDIDTNETWLKFAAMEADLLALATQCSAIPGAPKRLPPQIRSWWPGDLSDDRARPVDAYQFLACHADHGGYLAIDRKNARAYYWRTP